MEGMAVIPVTAKLQIDRTVINFNKKPPTNYDHKLHVMQKDMGSARVLY